MVCRGRFLQILTSWSFFATYGINSSFFYSILKTKQNKKNLEIKLEEKEVGHKPEPETSEVPEGVPTFSRRRCKSFSSNPSGGEYFSHTTNASVEVSGLQIYVYYFQTQTTWFVLPSDANRLVIVWSSWVLIKMSNSGNTKVNHSYKNQCHNKRPFIIKTCEWGQLGVSMGRLGLDSRQVKVNIHLLFF